MIIKLHDTVRVKGTDMIGKITAVHKTPTPHYTVKIEHLPAIVLYQDEIELFNPVTIVNPCYYCGAETPEGRTVCAACFSRYMMAT